MLTRRDFIAYFGGLAAMSAAVVALPDALARRGWWSPAYAEDGDLVLDTYNGLAAMLWPGNDAYSVAQGEWNARAGAMATNAGHHIKEALDGLVAQPYTALPLARRRMPLSAPVASAINAVALAVNPAATAGGFPSPFARLAFADKVSVWRRLEEDARQVSGQDPTHSLGALQFVVGVLPAFVLFFAFSEIDVLNPTTRTLTRRPIGWDHCGYLGGRLHPVEGWDDFLGYYQGRKEVDR